MTILLKMAQRLSSEAELRVTIFRNCQAIPVIIVLQLLKYSLQGTTQGRYLTGGVPPVRFSM